MEFEFPLGFGVKDKVTGFRGEILGRVEYTTGCRQYLIQPGVDDNGAWVESHWLDEGRLQSDPTWPSSGVVHLGDSHPASVGADNPAPSK